MAVIAARTARAEARAAGLLPPLHPRNATAVRHLSPRISMKHMASGKFFKEELKGTKSEPSDAEKGLEYFTAKLEMIRHKVFDEASPPIAGVTTVRDASSYLKEDLLAFVENILEDAEVAPSLKTRANILYASTQECLDRIYAVLPFARTEKPLRPSYFIASEATEDSGTVLEEKLTSVVDALKGFPDGEMLPSSFMDTAYTVLKDAQDQIQPLSNFITLEEHSGLNPFDLEERPRFIEAAYRTIKVAARIMHYFGNLHNYIEEIDIEAAESSGKEGKRADFEEKKNEVLKTKEKVRSLYYKIRDKWAVYRPTSDSCDSDEENAVLFEPMPAAEALKV